MSKTRWQEVSNVHVVLDSVVIRLYEGENILLKASVASSRCGRFLVPLLFALLSLSTAAPNTDPIFPR